MGRFITEDPIKDGNNWYTYCRNNPLTFIDPTGLIAGSIPYVQYQNVGENINAIMTGSPTLGYSTKLGFHTNTVGLYGCLLTATVNVANAHILKKHLGILAYDSSMHEKVNHLLHIVAEVAKDKTIFELIRKDKETTIAEEFREFDYSNSEAFGDTEIHMSNYNVDMNSKKVENALQKLTGENWSVSGNIRGEERIKTIINRISNDKDSTTYIMARVKNRHWVHIEGVDRNGNYIFQDTAKSNEQFKNEHVNYIKIMYNGSDAEARTNTLSNITRTGVDPASTQGQMVPWQALPTLNKPTSNN